MCAYNARCGAGGGCVASSANNGCQSLGNKCLGCGRALLAPVGGQSDVPTEGYLIFSESGFVGWMIKATGNSDLQKFDIVTAIDGVAPDADFFEAMAKQPAPQTLSLTVYRNGQLLTLVQERS